MGSSRTSVHQLCDQFVADLAALHPIGATLIGVVGYDDRLTDFSPQAERARAELLTEALRQVEAAEPADESERVARAVFLERMGVDKEAYDAGLNESSLNVIASPVQDIRAVFDLMSAETAEDWTVIGKRLAAVPDSIASVRAALTYSAGRGRVSPRRQVDKVAEQCDTWAGVTGDTPFFTSFAAGVDQVDGTSEELRGQVHEAARAAADAYREFAVFLRDELRPQAPEKDAVGIEEYRLRSRQFLGARIDLDEAYQWGWQEFTRLETEMKEVAERIKPGATLAEVAAQLDADPRYLVRGRDALAAWMQKLSDRALAEVRGVHFDLPDELMTLECLVAPPGGGVGAYYTGPTTDFSRPGRMWFSVPPTREEFPTWREVTTVYHEGVPGHHLQIATAVYQAERLNDFQRQLCFVSGHGEGWALYSERLMRELGYLEDDGNLLGMLDGQLFRAARVIVDIGMHLELTIPAGTGFHEGETWTPELGLEFLSTRTITDPAHVVDEIDRYLGWPGQAPAYKLGERLWLAAREAARARHGEAFDLKKFHREALEMGPMGLDTLREQLEAL